MRTVRWLLIVAFIVAAPCLVLQSASAEFFIDGYAGIALTNDADTTIDANGFSVVGTTKWKESFVGGGRVGYWFDTVPWLGLALDASYFQPEEDVNTGPAKIEVLPISLLVMLRAPLITSPDFPRGRLQPYMGVGPGAFYTKFKLDLNPVGIPDTISETSWDIGLDLRAGVTFLFTRNIGVFAEYRLTYVNPEWEANVQGATVTTDVDLLTNHFVGGLTFRF